MEASSEAAIVTIAGVRVEVAPDGTLSFGRATIGDVVGLDPKDRGISRNAGVIEFKQGWVLRNLSKTRPIELELAGVVRHDTVEPRGSEPLRSYTRIIVSGTVHSHAIDVELMVAEPADVSLVDHDESSVTDDLPISAADHLALVALAEGYLNRWPRHDPHPRTYQQAASRLSTSETTLRRRVEHLRQALAERGIPAAGPHALRSMLEALIDRGVITLLDHNRLPPGVSDGGGADVR